MARSLLPQSGAVHPPGGGRQRRSCACCAGSAWGRLGGRRAVILGSCPYGAAERKRVRESTCCTLYVFHRSPPLAEPTAPPSAGCPRCAAGNGTLGSGSQGSDRPYGRIHQREAATVDKKAVVHRVSLRRSVYGTRRLLLCFADCSRQGIGGRYGTGAFRHTSASRLKPPCYRSHRDAPASRRALGSLHLPPLPTDGRRQCLRF